MTKNMDVSKIIPSRENLAALLEDLNESEVLPEVATLCVMCEMEKAVRTEKTLCNNCWAELEVMSDDEYPDEN